MKKNAYCLKAFYNSIYAVGVWSAVSVLSNNVAYAQITDIPKPPKLSSRYENLTLEQQTQPVSLERSTMDSAVDSKAQEHLLTPLLEKATEAAKILALQTPMEASLILAYYGQERHSQADYAAAETAYRDALRLGALTDAPQERINSLKNRLASLLYEVGRFDEAEPLLQDLVDYAQQVEQDTGPDYASNLGNLGLVLMATNRPNAARAALEQALALDIEFYGERHEVVAVDLNNLGALAVYLGELERAERFYRKALAIDLYRLPENSPNISADYINLAGVLQDTGREEEALELYSKALEIDREAYGQTHPTVAVGLNNLATLQFAMKDFESAEQNLLAAQQINAQHFGETHPLTVANALNLANTLAGRNAYPEAIEIAQWSVTALEQRYGVHHVRVEAARTLLSTFVAGKQFQHTIDFAALGN